MLIYLFLNEVKLVNNHDLRKAGLKVTTPRIKILEILENSKGDHLNAEEVYGILKESGEDVGLATVYRVLTQFESAGLVIRHNFESGHSVYELDQGEHHDHMVCLKCGDVKEFIDETIELRQHQIAEEQNFKMTDHSLTIYGLCTHCS